MGTASTAATRINSRRDIGILDSLEWVANSTPRRIVLHTPGRRHGPITRLVSPSNLGELIKRFVFLDRAEVAPRPGPLFGIHTHSGIVCSAPRSRIRIGWHSAVHTSAQALARGEAEIRRIGSQLLPKVACDPDRANHNVTQGVRS